MDSWDADDDSVPEEVSPEVPAVVFHFGDTAQGEIAETSRGIIDVCLGNEETRWSRPQFRGSSFAWDSARLKICCERRFRRNGARTATQFILVRRCYSAFTPEAWDASFTMSTARNLMRF